VVNSGPVLAAAWARVPPSSPPAVVAPVATV
jgi:hypothetical protein